MSSLQKPLFHSSQPADKHSSEELARLWGILEELVTGKPDRQLTALKSVAEDGALARYPLATFLTATLLASRDGSLRAEAIRQLGAVLAITSIESAGQARAIVAGVIGKYGHQDFAALLESTRDMPALRGDLARLLNLNASAGDMLADVLGDRAIPMAVRIEAAYFIGQLGYSGALPTMERIAARLEARQQGQGAMPFAPPVNREEASLLPALQEAIQKLQPL